jgi:hypothetical protein
MGILIICAFLIFGNNNAQASNSVTITASVGAVPPSQPAIITSPQANEQINNSQTLVAGTCQPKTYITVLSNKSIRGGTMCDEKGNFTLSVSLDTRDNLLTAQTNDGIDQFGPESTPINVFVGSGLTGGGLDISVDKSYQRISQDDSLNWKIDLHGLSSIYAVKVDWGDGSNDLFPTRESNLILSHKYNSAGTRAIKITASDDKSNKGEINLVASVSSLDALKSGILEKTTNYLSKITLYITVILMVASFFVGNYYKGGKKYVWSKDTSRNV